MPDKELQCTLELILKKLEEKNGRCQYHEELHNKVQQALSETQILRSDITTIKDSIKGIRNDIKDRLDKGDGTFSEMRKEMQELSQKLTTLDTAMGTGLKVSDKVVAVILSVLVVVLMAAQVVLYILNK